MKRTEFFSLLITLVMLTFILSSTLCLSHIFVVYGCESGGYGHAINAQPVADTQKTDHTKYEASKRGSQKKQMASHYEQCTVCQSKLDKYLEQGRHLKEEQENTSSAVHAALTENNHKLNALQHKVNHVMRNVTRSLEIAGDTESHILRTQKWMQAVQDDTRKALEEYKAREDTLVRQMEENDYRIMLIIYMVIVFIAVFLVFAIIITVVLCRSRRAVSGQSVQDPNEQRDRIVRFNQPDRVIRSVKSARSCSNVHPRVGHQFKMGQQYEDKRRCFCQCRRCAKLRRKRKKLPRIPVTILEEEEANCDLPKPWYMV